MVDVMDQRISFVTLAVRDLDASRAFYVDGLGWTAALDVPGEVLMIQVGEHVVLSLWVDHEFEAEVGPINRGAGVAPITLAHNVATREEVDAVLATARAAGADPVHDSGRARLGRLHRLLRRPRRLPLGDRLQPRTDRTGGAPMTRPKTVLTLPPGRRRPGLADWRLLVGALHARFATGDFATGLALADRIGAAAEEADHHPDLDLRYPHLDVELVSHDVGGVTEPRPARWPGGSARSPPSSASRAAPGDVQVLELALDTADHAAVAPFWRGGARLRRQPGPRRPRGRRPGRPAARRSGSRRTEPHEEPRQRFHLDVVVPPERRRAADRGRPRRRRDAGQRRARPRRSGCSPTPRATRPASAPPEGRDEALTACRDRRPASWDACHTRMTGARAAATVSAMRKDILVRTRRVS